MHTDLTLDILDHLTTDLGDALWRFNETVCSAYEMQELPCKAASHHCQNATKVSSTNNSGSLRKRSKAVTDLSSNKMKYLNIHTYKFHALGDYVGMIQQYGMTDSYSTEPVSDFLAMHG